MSTTGGGEVERGGATADRVERARVFVRNNDLLTREEVAAVFAAQECAALEAECAGLRHLLRRMAGVLAGDPRHLHECATADAPKRRTSICYMCNLAEAIDYALAVTAPPRGTDDRA